MPGHKAMKPKASMMKKAAPKKEAKGKAAPAKKAMKPMKKMGGMY